MVRLQGRGRRGFRLVAGLLFILASGMGCQAEEAAIDGFYGGISDTVATLVSDALLSQLDEGP